MLDHHEKLVCREEHKKKNRKKEFGRILELESSWNYRAEPGNL